MHAYLKKLQTERDTLSDTATSITDKAAAEDRPVTDTERASIAKMEQRCAEIDADLVLFNDNLKSQRAYAKLRGELADVADDADAAPAPAGVVALRRPAEIVDTRSWGERFLDSGEFKSYRGTGASGRVDVPGIFTRAPIDSGGIGGLPVQPAVVTVAQPSFTTPLLNAVGHMTTNSQVVQWLIDDGTYPKAGVVAEGAAKPEANFTLATGTGTLQTYAHWKGITRQALSNLPMIQSIVENKLRGGIFAALEDAIATALAGATLGGVTVGTGGMLAAIRTAIATVQLQGYPNANSVLLNPADWAELDLSVFDSTNDGPTRQTGFWGLRPIASAAIPSGTAYVGDLNNGVTVFDEGKATVYMTDSHSDFFIKNILVILAEVMALAMVTAPGALVRVTPGGGG